MMTDTANRLNQLTVRVALLARAVRDPQTGAGTIRKRRERRTGVEEARRRVTHDAARDR